MCVKFSNYKEDFGLKKWYKSLFFFLNQIGVLGCMETWITDTKELELLPPAQVDSWTSRLTYKSVWEWKGAHKKDRASYLFTVKHLDIFDDAAVFLQDRDGLGQWHPW